MKMTGEQHAEVLDFARHFALQGPHNYSIVHAASSAEDVFPSLEDAPCYMVYVGEDGITADIWVHPDDVEQVEHDIRDAVIFNRTPKGHGLSTVLRILATLGSANAKDIAAASNGRLDTNQVATFLKELRAIGDVRTDPATPKGRFRRYILNH